MIASAHKMKIQVMSVNICTNFLIVFVRNASSRCLKWCEWCRFVWLGCVPIGVHRTAKNVSIHCCRQCRRRNVSAIFLVNFSSFWVLKVYIKKINIPISPEAVSKAKKHFQHSFLPARLLNIPPSPPQTSHFPIWYFGLIFFMCAGFKMSVFG